MKIEQLLDTDKLRSHIAEKLVAEQPNRTFGNIKIYNYGRKCQFDPNAWDDVTEKTRGLIVDWDDGEVLARPFRKFFNLGTGYRADEAAKSGFLHQGSRPCRTVRSKAGISERYRTTPAMKATESQLSKSRP